MRSIVCLALCLSAAPAVAQQRPAASTCDVQIDSSRRSRYVQAGSGYDTYAGGGIWAHCREQPTTMYSDSLAWYPERDLLYLMGHVRFEDSVSILNADHVTYYLHQERLFAEGNVYTKNLRTRSDLRGPNLDYYRTAPPIRDTLEIFARARPTINFYSAPRGDRPDSSEPFVVVADRTKMRGSDQMWGGGNVTIDRSDLAAKGDSGQLNLGQNVGALLGRPQVNGTGRDAYHLSGERIGFTLNPAHEIRRVLSSGQAAARGSDWHLDADTLDMTLDSGKVQLAEAWGRHERPDAVSGNHTITADSLDIHMPAQLVRLVWAYGHARTVTRDSASSEEDWITGDTLRADFAVVPGSGGGKPRSQLEHMTSFGSARALYHVEAADTSNRSRKGVNYSRGRRIDIATNDSKVQTVDVVGQVDGVYLEPLPVRADTAAARRTADSTKAVPADVLHAPAADTAAHAAPAPAPATPLRKVPP